MTKLNSWRTEVPYAYSIGICLILSTNK